MTLIGAVTIDIPVLYRRSGYAVVMAGSLEDSAGFNELRELFAKTEFGTAIHQVPGARPFGEDMTEDSLNTQYVSFSHGISGKAQDGYYLLRPGYSFADDESPEGHDYVFSLSLFFLGTSAYYQDGYKMKELDELDSDWGI